MLAFTVGLVLGFILGAFAFHKGFRGRIIKGIKNLYNEQTKSKKRRAK